MRRRYTSAFEKILVMLHSSAARGDLFARGEELLPAAGVCRALAAVDGIGAKDLAVLLRVVLPLQRAGVGGLACVAGVGGTVRRSASRGVKWQTRGAGTHQKHE